MSHWLFGVSDDVEGACLVLVVVLGIQSQKIMFKHTNYGHLYSGILPSKNIS